MLTIINKFKDNYNSRKAQLAEKGIFVYFKSQAGYVLIIVLIIISMLVAISTEFLLVAQTNINYMKKFSDKLKARTLAQAGVNLASFILMADQKGLAQAFLNKKTVDKNIDCFDDVWALNIPEIPLEDGSLKIKIEDENAKINLSVLANEFAEDTRYYGITQRFFLNLALPIDFADAIADWVDVDDSRHPYGAESSDYYLSLPMPYKAKNNAMDSIDELFMIKDVTPEIFYGIGGGNAGNEGELVEDNMGSRELSMDILSEETPQDMLETILNTSGQDSQRVIGKEKSRRLSDYFRVYGERTDILSELNKININTASDRVLSALTDEMTDDKVTEILSRRMTKPFSNIDEIKDLFKDWAYISNYLSVKSFIFRITAIGKVNTTQVKIIGYYYRVGKKFYFWSEQ